MPQSNIEFPCVCVHGSSRLCGYRKRCLTKTHRRRRVYHRTHGEQRFLSLLHAVRSSSVSKRLVILHTHSGWLYYERLDNGWGGAAAA